MEILLHGFDDAAEGHDIATGLASVLVELSYMQPEEQLTLEFLPEEVKFLPVGTTQTIVAPTLELPERFFYERLLMQTLSEMFPEVLVHAAGGFAHFGGKPAKLLSE